MIDSAGFVMTKKAYGVSRDGLASFCMCVVLYVCVCVGGDANGGGREVD